MECKSQHHGRGGPHAHPVGVIVALQVQFQPGPVVVGRAQPGARPPNNNLLNKCSFILFLNFTATLNGIHSGSFVVYLLGENVVFVLKTHTWRPPLQINFHS